MFRFAIPSILFAFIRFIFQIIFLLTDRCYHFKGFFATFDLLRVHFIILQYFLIILLIAFHGQISLIDIYCFHIIIANIDIYSLNNFFKVVIYYVPSFFKIFNQTPFLFITIIF